MRNLLLSTTAAAAVLALPAAAGAVIVPQVGMGGVRLDDTMAEVRQVAGKPLRVVRGTNDFGAYTQYGYRGFTVTFQGNAGVTAVSTRARLQRTRSGIGVGSTEAAVRRAYPRIACSTFSGFRSCVIGKELPGRTVTVFGIASGRVSDVRIGYVID